MRASPDVLIPLVTMNPSGGVRMVVHLANALAARGRRVVIAAPEGGTPPSIPLDPRVGLHTRPRGRRAFVASLARARVYVATGYTTPLLIACGALRHGGPARIVHLIQGDEPASHIAMGSRPAWLKPALALVARAGYRVPARRIAVSEFVALRVGRRRVHRVIPPGVDDVYLATPAPDRNAEARPIVAGVIASAAPVKGVRYALEAFAALSGRSNVRCVAWDAGEAAALPPAVTPFARHAGGTGAGSDIRHFYEACDIFVFPSLVEGFGLPPLEAMARGAAVVTADCGGVREYARDGENCLMVTTRSAAEIAAAVGRLVGGGALRARLREAGRATAERFTAARFAAECAGEIERMIDDAGRNS